MNNNINFAVLAQEVLRRLNIVEVAENEGLKLKRFGKNFFALCPFHAERTPSFSISPQKQIFYCFGCQKGGNAIHLTASLRGISKGKVIYQYAKSFGLIGSNNNGSPLVEELKKKAIKLKFKKDMEKNFDIVYFFMCDMVHAFRRAIKNAPNIEAVEAMQHHYQICDKLPDYEDLLDCMLGDYGEIPQVEAFREAKEVMNEWISRTSK